MFDAFYNYNAEFFITLSSVNAISDETNAVLSENHIPNTITRYGKSKLLAEQYILSQEIPG